VSSFLTQGGRLAVLDDFGNSEPLLNRFRIHRVSAPGEPLEMLQNNPQLQLAHPASSYGKGTEATHPIVEGIDRVVTNHPAALTTDPDVELTPILELADRAGKQHLLAVIGVIGDVGSCGLEQSPVPRKDQRPRSHCGRLFAMADPSVFIDLMMTFDGNKKLASGLIDYLLQDDGWGARQGKLYIFTNDFAQTGHYGGSETLQQRALEALENASDALASVRKDGLPERVAWGLAVCVCLGLCWAAWRVSGSVYQRPVPRFASSPALVAQGGTMGKAAVLSRPGTSEALVVLELKNAIETFLREHLGLPRNANHEALLDQLKRDARLDGALLLRLSTTLAQMRGAEQSLLTPNAVPPASLSLKQMHAVLESTVEQLRAQSRSTP
jgi:hypothetical protein